MSCLRESLKWGSQSYSPGVVKAVDVPEAMQAFAKQLLLAVRRCLAAGFWTVKKADEDVVVEDPGEGAIDGIMENPEGEVALCDVKVRPFGRSEKSAACLLYTSDAADE